MRESRAIRPTLSLTAGMAILLVATGLAGCSNATPETGEQPEPVADTSHLSAETKNDAPDETDQVAGDGDYAFGTDREQIAIAIEKGLASKNASARWEGDTLFLSMEGDAEGLLVASDCRVVSELIVEGDFAVIEYPNGKVDCTEVLSSSD